MIALEGDCKTPLAAHAERVAGEIRVRAFVAEPDGSSFRSAERMREWPASEEDARAIGLELGAELAGKGAPT